MLPLLLAQADSAAEGFVSAVPIDSIDLSAVNDAAGAAGVGLGLLAGGFVIFWIILAIVGLAFFIWWIVLLVDLLNRQFEQRTTYLIIMILGLVFGFVWLADLIYYFAVVKKGVGSKGGAKPAAPAAPTA